MIRTNPPSELVYAERIAQVIELLQGKWTVHVLCALCKRPVRPGELRRALPAVSKKSLTASLRSFEAVHVVMRRDLSGHVEYQLTEPMRESLPLLLAYLTHGQNLRSTFSNLNEAEHLWRIWMSQGHAAVRRVSSRSVDG
jgi:DNA-binding HxlR family transcriptional regulator